MAGKININATEVPMDQNTSAENPVEINKNEVLNDPYAAIQENITIHCKFMMIIITCLET